MTMNKLLGRVQPGLCRLSMNGIAIQTSGGYKVYNVETGNLVNCTGFVFDVGEDMFFAIPTNDVRRGDVILVNQRPVCVIKVEDNLITAMDYELSQIVTVVPERFSFFGSMYIYQKIVSVFGDMTGGKMNAEKMMPMMLMSEMMKGNGGNSDFGKMMAMSMMMNGGVNPLAMFGAAAPAEVKKEAEE